jgi:hypothetical protein
MFRNLHQNVAYLCVLAEVAAVRFCFLNLREVILQNGKTLRVLSPFI